MLIHTLGKPKFRTSPGSKRRHDSRNEVDKDARILWMWYLSARGDKIESRRLTSESNNRKYFEGGVESGNYNYK